MVRPKRAAPVTVDDDDDGEKQQESKAKKKQSIKPGRKRKLPVADEPPPQPSSEPQPRRRGRVPGKKGAETPMNVEIVNGHQQTTPFTGPDLVAVDAGTASTSRKPMNVDDEPRKRGRKAKQTVVHDVINEVKVARNRRHDRGPGQVLVCGQNDIGQLGLGEEIIERSLPTLVAVTNVDDCKVVDVCAGGMHTVCLTQDGMVFTFGCNDEGALGRDTSDEGSEYKPGRVDIADAKIVVQVSAGDSHTAALTDDGHVYVWGNFRDASGSMGLVSPGRKEDRPVRLSLCDEVVKISSGSDHLVLLTVEGSVLTLGIAEQGQLGRIGERFATREARKGTTSMLTPTPARSGRLVFDNVWATTHATFARVKETNEIFAAGLNNYEQLGIRGVDRVFFLEPILSFAGRKWLKIAGDIHHTLALDEAGQVHVLGRKEYGRLGLGEKEDDKHEPTPVPAIALIKCVDIACGRSTSYAVTNNGVAYAWGMGSSNQLGNADVEDRWEPCQIRGKQLVNRKVIGINGGAQHVVLLAERAAD